MTWRCESCEEENEEQDQRCACCDEERPASVKKDENEEDEDDQYKNICVGKVVDVEAVSGRSDAKKLKVDVGSSGPVTIVTTSMNVNLEDLVVVATVGATLNEELIKKKTVFGVGSEGMLCGSAELNWKGGGSQAVVLPSDGKFKVGDKPPSERPRGK